MQTCIHLEPLEHELEAQGVPLEEGGDSPYGPEWGVWFPVSCTFDADSLRERLKIDACVSYEEYDGRVAGSDATWYCKECKRAIMGMLSRYAPAGVKRVK
ncbi:MAG TPA: hypothetical protein VGV35_19135 [Bryobacteraceae bacterium]|nr:hypothetical protein [Bryobacteraceae bacterium]